MARLKRLVLHCTATPEGREVSAADIRHWHCDPVSKGGRGWKQVGYTDMIHLDGKVGRVITPPPGTWFTWAALSLTARPQRIPARWLS